MAMPAEPDMGLLEAHYCFTAYKLNRSFARFYQAVFGDTGLTYPKYVILNVLAENGPLAISQLSERAGVESNTLSPLLKRMAEVGVVERARDPKDERRVVVTLTDMGRTALTAARVAVAAGFADLGLDPDEVRRSITYMGHAQAKLDAAKPARLTMAALTGQSD